MPIEKRKPRPFLPKIKRKIATLRAAKLLRQGGVLAHQTGTLAGVAASPDCMGAIKKIQRFKCRKGPFLLLAASASKALKQARYIPVGLRKLAKESWPGAVSLLFPAKPGLPNCAYQKGYMAVRVDADVECRRLAKLCGGLLLSSSLNRRSEPTMAANRACYWRYSAYLSGVLMADSQLSSGVASHIYRFKSAKVERLR